MGYRCLTFDECDYRDVLGLDVEHVVLRGLTRRQCLLQHATARPERQLWEFIGHYYETIADFERDVGLNHSTLFGWLRPREPNVPDMPSLVRLVCKTNINLHWLLDGEPPELRERSSALPTDVVDAAIEAQLRQTEDAGELEFQTAWERMTVWGEGELRRDVVLRLATEGVWPRFQENLRMVRFHASLAGVYEVLRRAIMQYRELDPKTGDKLSRKLDRLFS